MRMQGGQGGPIEITDAMESYLDKFCLALIDKNELTSVS